MKTKQHIVNLFILGTGLLLQPAHSATAPATKVAAGYFHSLFLKADGSLWAMGDNGFGQLGDGVSATNAPYGTNQSEMIVASNVTSIAAGGYHSLFLKSNGSLWGMGANNNGQLGDGTFANTNRPVMIVESNVTAIAAGANFSLFVKSNGSLWAMGYNYSGQLGDGTFNSTNRPEQIMTASNVFAVAAGGHHSLFVMTNGTLWAMGDNSSGQLGNGTYINTNRPVQILQASNITAVAAGDYHSLFLRSDNTLWAMGYNFYGQLGDGSYSINGPYYGTNQPELVSSNVIMMTAGDNHSLFVKTNGSLWAMGYNVYGQLGDGTSGAYNQTNTPEQIVSSGVTAIAGGQYHSLFAKSNGTLWAMGANSNGQLGDGTYSLTNQPEQIVPKIVSGNYHLSAQLLSNGDVRLSFNGDADAKYALDRSFSLAPVDWVPQSTNPADSAGMLVLTNIPVNTTNNFWRMRLVP